MRIAFYAPLKAPTHPVPSGDRRVARLLRAALTAAGHDVVLASEFRAYEGRGDGQAQSRIADQGAAEAERLIALWRKARKRPDLWLSYHVYHKSPDHIGPAVARALALPYVIAEPSVAPKRAEGPFAAPYAAASGAIAAADLLLCMTDLDVAGVAEIAPRRRIAHLPPFLDTALFSAQPRPEHTGNPRLLCVAMMRPGDKLQSYRRLGQALAQVPGMFELRVVGGGEARSDVEKALAPLGAAVRYLGLAGEDELPGIYAAADIYVWPAAGEAYGMALLEAQASGLPVVAGAVRGVPEIVIHGETGLLVPEDDAAAFADAVRRLLQHAGLRRRLGAGAARHAESRHGLKAAAARLDQLLAPLVAAPRAAAGQ